MVSHDLVAITGPVDLDTVRAHLQGVQVAVCLGEFNRRTPTEAFCVDLAANLACPLIAAPGAHSAPRDHPARFAAVVEQVLQSGR